MGFNSHFDSRESGAYGPRVGVGGGEEDEGWREKNRKRKIRRERKGKEEQRELV